MKRLFTSLIILSIAVLSFSTPIPEVSAEQVSKEQRLILLLNTRQIYQSGSMYLAPTPHIIKYGVTYISMRSLAERLGYRVSYIAATRQSKMANPENSLAVSQNSQSYNFNGKQFAFKNDAKPYITNGTLMVPLRDIVTLLDIRVIPKLSENKVELIWTDQIKIEERVFYGSFETNKVRYRIGEPVSYYDTSVAIGSSIINAKWINNEAVFFEPGPQTISLTVINNRGERSVGTRTIFIEDEVMYTKRQYAEWFTPVGEKLAIVREEVLDFEVIPFNLKEQPLTLALSNSPERIVREGIYFEDKLEGTIRFLIHKQNARPNPVKIYLLAKNEGSETATVTLDNLGMSSPVRYVSSAGKNSVVNYLTSLLQQSIKNTIEIEPNRTKVIVPDLSNRSILPEHILTMYADIYSNQKLTFQVVILDEVNDLYQTLPYLPGINAERDGKHKRGTFENGNRQLTVSQLIGTELGRLIIADGVSDPWATGIDPMGGTEERNTGNYGVLYELTLEKVAANTALVLNPRGGHYAGAFLVNDELVRTPTNGIIAGPNETVVLYRTGNKEEKVTLVFTPASGSNLPINILTIPLKVEE